MRLVLIEPPAVEPLTAEEVKARLSIGSEVSDEVLDALIAAARQQIDGADGWLGRAFISQTWRGTLDGFPCSEIGIPLPPLQDILSVQHTDGDGMTQELDPAEYQIVQGRRAYIIPAFGKSWPATRCTRDAVTIEFIAGYGDDPEDVPEPIRTAIALQTRHLISLASRDAGLTQRIVNGVSSRTWAADGGAAGAAALDGAITSLLSTYRVFS